MATYFLLCGLRSIRGGWLTRRPKLIQERPLLNASRIPAAREQLRERVDQLSISNERREYEIALLERQQSVRSVVPSSSSTSSSDAAAQPHGPAERNCAVAVNRLLFCVNLFSHCVHAYGFSPVWTLMCLVKSFFGNFFPHCIQAYGLCMSPV